MKRFLIVVALLSLVSAAAAEDTVVVKRFDTGSTKARWTADRFALAKPMALPRVEHDPARVDRAPVKAAVGEPFEELFPSAAEEPTLKGREAYRYRRQLFDYSREELRRLRGLDEAPEPRELPGKNYGTAGLDYTSSRLIPSSAVESFPYRPVGKLFFSIGDWLPEGPSDPLAETDHIIHGALLPAARHGTRPVAGPPLKLNESGTSLATRVYRKAQRTPISR